MSSVREVPPDDPLDRIRRERARGPGDPEAALERVASESRAKARQRVRSSSFVDSLKVHVATMRSTGAKYRAAVAEVAKDSRYTKAGKAELIGTIREEWAGKISAVCDAFDSDERYAYELFDNPVVPPITAGQVARINAAQFAFPHLSSRQQIAQLEGAVLARDVVMVAALLPFAKSNIEDGGRWKVDKELVPDENGVLMERTFAHRAAPIVARAEAVGMTESDFAAGEAREFLPKVRSAFHIATTIGLSDNSEEVAAIDAQEPFKWLEGDLGES